MSTEELRRVAVVSVYCDLCGNTHSADYLVGGDDTLATRLGYARANLLTLGWTIEPGWDMCARCATGGTLNLPAGTRETVAQAIGFVVSGYQPQPDDRDWADRLQAANAALGVIAEAGLLTVTNPAPTDVRSRLLNNPRPGTIVQFTDGIGLNIATLVPSRIGDDGALEGLRWLTADEEWTVEGILDGNPSLVSEPTV